MVLTGLSRLTLLTNQQEALTIDHLVTIVRVFAEKESCVHLMCRIW